MASGDERPAAESALRLVLLGRLLYDPWPRGMGSRWSGSSPPRRDGGPIRHSISGVGQSLEDWRRQARTLEAAAKIRSSFGIAAVSRFFAYGSGTSAIPTRSTGASRSSKQAFEIRAASSAVTP